MPLISATEKQIYAGALALLLIIWLAISAATAVFLVLLFLPEYAGFADSLRSLDVLLPTDPVLGPGFAI